MQPELGPAWAYGPGDTVFLERKPYVIDDVGTVSVSWHDPSFPLLRGATTIQDFDLRLAEDRRNAHLQAEKGAAEMPTSKRGNLYFTNEQYKQARACGALEYAQARDYDLVRDCNSYHLREHDSMVFTSDGRWFWNSRGLAGRALEFMQYYEKMTLPEAVLTLVGDAEATPASPGYSPAPREPFLPKPFELPPKAGSFKRLFAYLCGTRCLDAEIVKELVESKRIYESARRLPPDGSGRVREVHNAVFVSFDSDGHPRSAFQRGLSTMPEHTFKRDAAGSDKSFPFCVPGYANTDTVAVFEASIDAVSHATLAKLSGQDYKAMDRIALGGVAAAPLLRYLRGHPAATRIKLCLDSDAAGATAMEQIKRELLTTGYTPARGFEILTEPPGAGCKDWNDYLRLWHSIQAGQEAGVRPPPALEEGGEREL